MKTKEQRLQDAHDALAKAAIELAQMNFEHYITQWDVPKLVQEVAASFNTVRTMLECERGEF